MTIAEIQAALNRAGAHPQLEITGKVDARTTRALAHFQETHHLFICGIADGATQKKLKEYA